MLLNAKKAKKIRSQSKWQRNKMSEIIHTSSSLVTVVYSLLLESSSWARRLLSWHNLSFSSRQALISFSSWHFSDDSWSINASPSAISTLPTNHSHEAIVTRWLNNQQLAKLNSTKKRSLPPHAHIHTCTPTHSHTPSYTLDILDVFRVNMG